MSQSLVEQDLENIFPVDITGVHLQQAEGSSGGKLDLADQLQKIKTMLGYGHMTFQINSFLACPYIGQLSILMSPLAF